ncbi:MAG TPA: tryptophan--tRNA ligase [Polyangia bacterium]
MRILSGIQPSGALHIGNYFGMIRPALELARQGDAFYFIADYHALTSVAEPDALRRNVRAMAVDLLALGLEPARTVFFRQSDVPEVTELAWILSTVTPLGLLERGHAYKDKVQKGLAATHGLFAYPVLMAADILLYRTDVVPVGEDQRQHLEIARDIAAKLNQQYGPVLTLPQGSIQREVAAVPGLDGQKMSKSYGNTIEIFADERTLRRRCMSIKTDALPVEAPKDPAQSVPLALYRLFAPPAEVETTTARYRKGGLGYAELKLMLFEQAWAHFGPARERREALDADPAAVERVLADGAARARAVARVTLDAVRHAVGLR